MRCRWVFLALAGCMLSSAAWSQPIQGFYIGGGAGLLLPFPIKSTSLEPGVGGRFEIKQNPGYDAQLSVGYALGDGWRFELEGTMGRGTVKGVSGTAFSATGGGSVQNRGIMVNALFDLDIRSPYVFPYVGVGVGYQWTRLDNFVDTRTSAAGEFSASGVTGGIAGQAIGGLSFPIPNMPGLSLTVDYRITDILAGEKFNGTSTIGAPAGSAPRAGSIKFNNQFDQIVMFGVRYAFNTPPPPAAVASTASRADAQSYEVAFDPDKAILTGRAQSIVRDAALASTRQGTTRIAVTGREGVQAGASSALSDHVSLSGRRVNIVLAALVAQGVPRNDIAVQASGEDLVVRGQTHDRRIEIVTR
jgi:OOP family OmpA-OmpF porin